jgi:5'(3')-deoxyribonucleotidase
MNMTIFLDMDGVIADYDLGYTRIGGEKTDKGSSKAKRLKPYPHFYRDLPPTNDCMKLWHFLAPYKPVILSAQSNFVPHSKEDKIHWLKEHLGLTDTSRIIICNYPTDKQKHCEPGAILIDDNTKNCSEWVNAGGVAIIHKSAEDTIRKLKAILEHDKHTETPHVAEAFDKLKEAPVITENVERVFQQLNDECCCINCSNTNCCKK